MRVKKNTPCHRIGQDFGGIQGFVKGPYVCLPQTMEQPGIPRALSAENPLQKERELSFILKSHVNFCLLAVYSEAPVDGEGWV